MNDVLVLCYHALSEHWPAALSITPTAFERQIAGMVRRGWVGSTFTEAVFAPTRRRTLAVTFDDAYLSVATRAAPILERLGVPATVFVPTDWPDRAAPMRWPGIDHWLGTAHEAELTPLTWEGLRQLADQGWEIGSHTCSHPRLSALDNHDLMRELTVSRSACEAAIRRPCRSIAYPYGDVDARVVAATGAAGYEAAAALPGTFGSPTALEWPRVGVWHVDGQRSWRFALKVASPVRRLRALAGH